MPSIVTRPVITSMAPAIRLNWRTVVAVTWGWRQWKSVTISTIGEFRCGLRVVVLHNATLHDNGPPHLIFGEGIVVRKDNPFGLVLIAKLVSEHYLGFEVLSFFTDRGLHKKLGHGLRCASRCKHPISLPDTFFFLNDDMERDRNREIFIAKMGEKSQP